MNNKMFSNSNSLHSNQAWMDSQTSKLKLLKTERTHSHTDVVARQAGRRGRAQATGSGREREAAITPRQCNLRTHYDLTSNNMYVVWFMFTVTVSNYSSPWLLNVVSYHNWQKYFNEILMVWRPWGLGRRCTRAQRILKNEILDGLQQRLDIN